MSSVREMADPHLAAIRMVTESMMDEGKAQSRAGQRQASAGKRQEKIGSRLEGARYGLFKALCDEDYTKAADWLNTLETGMGFLEAAEHQATDPIAKALVALRDILEDETEEVPE